MYSEDYCCSFLEDVFRLFQEEDISVIYKPKRNWESGHHPCPSRISAILHQVQGNSRWTTLRANINPWIPVLLSDLVVAIPFTSICFAAQSRAIPSVFHDPGHTIRYHSYGEYESRISNSYERLALYVSETEARQDIEGEIGTNGDTAQRFVNFLRDPKGLSMRVQIDEPCNISSESI